MVLSPSSTAKQGEQIYDEKYRIDFEKRHPGRFVAIDVDSQRAHVGDSPVEVLEKARKENPKGVFHLIRVGSPGVYRMGYSGTRDDGDWVFG